MEYWWAREPWPECDRRRAVSIRSQLRVAWRALARRTDQRRESTGRRQSCASGGHFSTRYLPRFAPPFACRVDCIDRTIAPLTVADINGPQCCVLAVPATRPA